MREIEKICGLRDLPHFIKEIVSQIKKNSIILLKGDLAAGKTTFVKEFVKAIGLHNEVSSPTFSLLQEYENKVCHYDIYQKGFDGFLQSGLLEKLEEPKYHIVEWADAKMEQVLKKLEMEYVVIEIQADKNKRSYKVTINAHS